MLRRLPKEGKPMKAVAIVVLVVLGFSGCAVPSDRPDLRYTSKSACEGAGRTWNGTSGVCM